MPKSIMDSDMCILDRRSPGMYSRTARGRSFFSIGKVMAKSTANSFASSPVKKLHEIKTALVYGAILALSALIFFMHTDAVAATSTTDRAP